mmetsp:Transcript_16757/g.52804  ORF Transcript_16757/g.52804 Transcript_16757/m.52804 type:complete len:807 (+) Transcript_16757:34-2454(+)
MARRASSAGRSDEAPHVLLDLPVAGVQLRLDVAALELALHLVLVLARHNVLEGQLLPGEVRVEAVDGPGDVEEAARGDPGGVAGGGALEEHAGHEDDVEDVAQEHVPEFADPEEAAEVRLPRLREGDEVAVDEPADSEVEEGEQPHGRAEGAEDDGDEHVDGPSRAPGAEAVVVLVLGLGHGGGHVLAEDGPEGEVLAQGHVAQDVHAVCGPVHHHEVHVEVSGEGHGRAQRAEEGHRALKHRCREFRDVLAYGRHKDDKDELEVKVHELQLVLGGGVGLQREAELQDQEDEGRQESDHEREAHGGRQALPGGLQGAHIHGLGDVCDADDQGHVGHVEPDDEKVTRDRPARLRRGVLREIGPEHVLGLRRDLDVPLLLVLGDGVEPQRYLRIGAVVKGHKAVAAVAARVADGLRVLQDLRPHVLHLLPDVLELVLVVRHGFDLRTREGRTDHRGRASVLLSLLRLEEVFLGSLEGLLQCGKVLRVLGHVGVLDPVGAREHLLEKLLQRGVRAALLADVHYQDGVGPDLCHVLQPSSTQVHKLVLRVHDAVRDAEYHAPNDEGVDPIEPAAVLDVAEGEIAEVVRPSGVAAEDEVHGTHDQQHRAPGYEADLHAELGELQEHGVVHAARRDPILLAVAQRGADPAEVGSCVRIRRRGAVKDTPGVYEGVMHAQQGEDHDTKDHGRHVRNAGAYEGIHVAGRVQGQAQGVRRRRSRLRRRKRRRGPDGGSTAGGLRALGGGALVGPHALAASAFVDLRTGLGQGRASQRRRQIPGARGADHMQRSLLDEVHVGLAIATRLGVRIEVGA